MVNSSEPEPEPEPGNKGIDASVGGLVWVRRRNGSWWPGRVIGLDEFREGCLVPPRSGTPVKLLGRDDASVDWYNLEKSRRVKAFRCGEYDECIEKAKAAAANSNRKAVKYARREDAIIHALELESARLGVDRPDFCSRTDNSGGEHDNSARESPTAFHSGEESKDMINEENGSEDNSHIGHEFSRSAISFEEPNHVTAPKVQLIQGTRRKTPNDSEDDGTEGTKRMRGLVDLGMGVASRKKVQSKEVLEVVQQDSSSLCDSNTRTSMLNRNLVNGDIVYSSSKRKRSQMPNVHEFLKKKNRRRPLTKVLESAAMVSIPVSDSPLCGSDSKVSEPDSNDLKRTFSVVVNNNSDSTGVSCENGVLLNGSEHACDASQTHNKKKADELSSISGLEENTYSDKLFDVPFVGNDKQSAGVSPLLLSCSSEKPLGGALGSSCSQSSQAEAGPLINEGHNESGSTGSGAAQVNDISKRLEHGTSEWQSKRKRNSRFSNKNGKQDLRKYVDNIDDELSAGSAGIEQMNSDCNGIGETLTSNKGQRTRVLSTEVKPLTDSSLIPQRSLPFRQSRFIVPSRYQIPGFPVRNFCSASQLYDVDLVVKANYRPQHVPIVSLMSKFDGKAIIGHPLSVEILDDGTSDLLMSRLEDAELGYTIKPTSEAGGLANKRSKLQRHFSRSKQPKLRKCEKIRKLSSLTASHQLCEEERKPVLSKLSGPAITCIPLKLVFSRINEAVNGLARPPHRGSTSGDSLVGKISNSISPTNN